MSNMSWSDDAIVTSTQDHLQRRSFVSRVSRLIDDSRCNGSSTVFSLVGPWGSGKSSLINLIRECLESNHPGWTVREHTPWAATSLDALLAEFFATLESALPSTKGDTAKTILRRCANFAVPAISLVPVAGDALAGVAALGIARLTERGPWKEAFQEACAAIKSLNVSVLIVIDDIDRLQVDEFMTLMRAIRLLGRFPNVHYLLSYDQRTISDIVSQSGLADGNFDRADAFIEKIVQYPISIPPVQAAHARAIFLKGVSAIAETELRTGEAIQRDVADLFDELLMTDLNTVRAINRFINQFEIYYSLIGPGEINAYDLICLTYLRLHAPVVYAHIPEWKSALIAPSMPHDTQDDPRYRLLQMTNWNPEKVARVASILGLLFPMTVRNGERSLVRRRDSQIGRRVCDGNYFSRYFSFTLPEGDVSDVLIREALQHTIASGHGDSLSRFWGVINEGPRRKLAIEKMRVATADIPEPNIPAVCDLCSRTLALLPEDDSDGREAMTYWLVAAITRWPSWIDVESDTIEGWISGESNLRVWANAVAVAYMGSKPTNGPLHDIAKIVSKASIRAIQTHLENKDHANVAGIGSLVLCASETGAGTELRAAIIAGLKDKRWGVEDVASRFVMVDDSRSDSPPRFFSLDEQGLFAILPLDVVRQYETEIRFAVSAFELESSLWGRRRRFAAAGLIRVLDKGEK